MNIFCPRSPLAHLRVPYSQLVNKYRSQYVGYQILSFQIRGLGHCNCDKLKTPEIWKHKNYAHKKSEQQNGGPINLQQQASVQQMIDFDAFLATLSP